MTRHSFVSTLIRYTVSLEYIEHENKLVIKIIVPLSVAINTGLLYSLFYKADIEIHHDGSRSYSGTIRDANFQKAFLEEYYLHGENFGANTPSINQ